MRIQHFQEIDGFQVVTGYSDPTPDPQKTDQAVKAKHPDFAKMPYADLLKAYSDNAVYATPLANSISLSNENAALQEFKFKSLQGTEKLIVSGEVIQDNRKATYWQKVDDTWMKLSIESLGEDIPPDAVFEKDLSPSQKSEIDGQKERTRLAGLTPEERQAEMENLINGAASEALRYQDLADLKGETFNKTAWFQTRKAAIESQYMTGTA
jgi:hypothetical protein